MFVKNDSAFSAMVVSSVNYGIDDRVCFYYEYEGVDGLIRTSIRRSKIRYDKDGRAYFMGRGQKNYLDEFMEVA